MRLILDGPAFLALIDACDTAHAAHVRHAQHCDNLFLSNIAEEYRRRAERITDLLAEATAVYTRAGIDAQIEHVVSVRP